MTKEIFVLCTTAAAIGFFHTIFGPDHYLPFIVMSKARKWSMVKTSVITVLCGIGHVASSVVLGLIGIAFGLAVMKLEAFEAFRGNLAAWAFIGFGFMYFIWGVRKAIKNKPHTHFHVHVDDELHSHKHSHKSEHAHVHQAQGEKKSITPWILFTIFVLGPCEPLIPILMYPAAKSSISGMVLVASVFSVVTILTMLTVVMVSSWGTSFTRLSKLERYAHALAGATICCSGLAIQFLGL
ncbi:MAG: sulfite exporter TauE/SafE family protein [Candidatus Tantalella remota]|nr:sulfite exporter TauE/SafE family protein [Candidatus Tantalella remota]